MDTSSEENQQLYDVRAKILARLGFALWMLSLIGLPSLLHQFESSLSDAAGLGVIACLVIALVPPLAIIAVPFMAITLFPLVGVICAVQVNLLIPIMLYNLERNRYPRRSLIGTLVFAPSVAILTAMGCNPLPAPHTVTWPNVAWWAGVMCVLAAGLLTKEAYKKAGTVAKPRIEIGEQASPIEGRTEQV